MNEHFTEIVTLFIYVLLFKVKGKIGHLVETGIVSTIHNVDIYLGIIFLLYSLVHVLFIS